VAAGRFAAAGWASAGLLLLTLARVVCWLDFLSLLATVRGGTSFLCPNGDKETKQRKRLPTICIKCPQRADHCFWFPNRTVLAKPRTLETLLLANPYIPTLRHQCSRASSMHRWTGMAIRLCTNAPVANSAKENSQHLTRANLRSTNPPPTPPRPSASDLKTDPPP
jgi:hypothetical protein